jgi:hypothetical protein
MSEIDALPITNKSEFDWLNEDYTLKEGYKFQHTCEVHNLHGCNIIRINSRALKAHRLQLSQIPKQKNI